MTPRFLVRNTRPRQAMTIFGRALRAGRPSRKVPAGEMWVTAEQLQTSAIVKKLRLKRLTIADCEGTTMEEVQAFLDSVVFVDPGEDSKPTAGEVGVEITRELMEEESGVRRVLPSRVAKEDEDPDPELEEPVEEEDPEDTPVEEVPEPEEPDLEDDLDSEEPVEEVPEPVLEDDPSGPDTLEELEALGYRELQGLAGDLGLAANGRKAELVKRIYDYQNPSEG